MKKLLSVSLEDFVEFLQDEYVVRSSDEIYEEVVFDDDENDEFCYDENIHHYYYFNNLIFVVDEGYFVEIDEKFVIKGFSSLVEVY